MQIITLVFFTNVLLTSAFFIFLLKLETFKDALSDLRQFLATESPLKMIKNAFYFTLKALFHSKIFKFLSGIFGRVEKTD